MKKIILFFSLSLLLAVGGTSRAWAVACPIGGPIYHGSGQSGAAIAECSDRIKKAQAAGKKLPNPEAWRASNPCAGISGCSPYPLSWSSAPAKANAAEAKPAQARSAKQAGDSDAVAAKRVRPEPASSATTAKRDSVIQSAATVSPLLKPALQPPPSPVTSNANATPRIDDAILLNVQGRPTISQLATDTKPELPVEGAKVSTLEKRIALVIGNSSYNAHPSLDNPRNDAKVMAETLREVGFRSVTVVYDAGREHLSRALQAFAVEAETADWALVYYAGHGIEVGGANYLVPVDAKLQTDRDVGFEAVGLEQVLNAVEPAQKLRLIILDACRDNPFMSRMRRTLVSRSIGRGLAPIETDRSMLVVFAAKHGQISLDKVDGENSPFTTSLVRWMKAPGMELNKVLRHVRDDVMKITKQQQEPYQYGSLSSEDFYFQSKEFAATKN